MVEKKVTRMRIEVDLQCGKCYRKIKKVLCSFPQIRDQIYDEEKNTVIITVVCCSPEKIKAKICCKGGDTIIGIEIIPEKPPPKTDPPKPPKPGPPPKTDPPKPSTPVPPPVNVVRMCCCPPCSGGYGPCCCPPCYGGYGPCCYGYRPLPLCHDGCGRPAYECQGGRRGYYVSSCGDCFSDENASGCTVM